MKSKNILCGLSIAAVLLFGAFSSPGPIIVQNALTSIVISPTNAVMVAGSNEVFTATGYPGGVSLTATNGLVWSSSNPGAATINTNGVATGLTGGTTVITATFTSTNAINGSVSTNTALTVQVPLTAQTNQFLFTGSETNITLPPGTYIITTYGAQGGSGASYGGGLGAEVEGKFSFSGLTTLTLLVGNAGGGGGGGFEGGGGGGGSFVVNGSTPLVVAGGGGGGNYFGGGDSGQTGTSGDNGSGGGAGGAGGNGGAGGSNGGGGGGGYSGGGGGAGGSEAYGAGGSSFSNGGYGGGGFEGGGVGGGGGGGFGGGGGGGYSGGGGGGQAYGGGGGGSIIDSSVITNLAEVSGVASPDDSPNGEIIITAVSAPTLTNLVISPASPVIAVGSNLQFTVTEQFSDGSSQVITNGGTNSLWSSSNPAVATITTNGVVAGWSRGVTTISATLGSISGTTSLAVSNGVTTWYVWTNSPANGPGTTWATAYHDIQSAVNVTANGDSVLVTNGFYSNGGVPAPGNVITNRVMMTNVITVRSVNGPSATIINGMFGSAYSNSVRCVYMGTGATLSGFTLTNGYTYNFDAPYGGVDGSGGGVWAVGSAILTNCIITGCWQYGGSGAGVYGGNLYNCIISNNRGFDSGGAAYSTIAGSIISGNSVQNLAASGGGTLYCTANNCLISGNSAGSGGGAAGGILEDCTVVSNSSSSASIQASGI